MNALTKYKIGLAVIGGLGLVLLFVLIGQAQAVKQDKKTYDAASKVADKLNDYTLSRGVPSSLSAAGISAPKEVTYEKVSPTKYRFCVEYKAGSSGFNATNLIGELMTGGAYQNVYSSDKEAYYLYLDSSHKKGNNCQTIRSTDTDYTTTAPATTDDCNYDANGHYVSDTAYYDCLNKKDGTTAD